VEKYASEIFQLEGQCVMKYAGVFLNGLFDFANVKV
jgi:hypothetical protein